MRFTVAAIVLFTSVFSDAEADYMDYHFEVRCDSQNNRAEILPYAVWNTDVHSAAPQDRVLASGRTIRTKMGLGPVYPYGMGGADPSKWLSVWVDKARVLSQIHFGCGDEGPCSIRIIVTAKDLTVCHREPPDVLTQEEQPDEPEERCELTPEDMLLTERDSIEFPSSNERARPPAGSLATLFAKDDQFCAQFPLLSIPRGRDTDNIWPRIGLPSEAQPVEATGSSPYEYSGSYQQYDFDIDNDGKKEIVIGLHARTHYRDGDIYFVYTDEKIPNPTVDRIGSTQSELAYAEAAKQIVPQDWSDHVGKEDESMKDYLAKGEYSVRNVGAPWWDGNDTPQFCFRYWYLWPFRYKQSTYFLSWSQEAGKQHWYTILRPETHHKVTEMCVFQTVPVRY